MNKYRVTVTRLIEEECQIYVDAADEEAAAESALILVEEEPITDAIWLRSDTMPHTYTIERVASAEKV